MERLQLVDEYLPATYLLLMSTQKQLLGIKKEPLIFINNQKPFSTYRSTKQNICFISFVMHFSFPKLFFLLLPE